MCVSSVSHEKKTSTFQHAGHFIGILILVYDNPHIPGQYNLSIWVFPKIGVPQNGWFIMENPVKIDDLGVPLFSETPIP